MPARAAITSEWARGAREARAFTVVGGWGQASGIVAMPAERRAWFAGARAPLSPRTVALVAPQWPGLEDSDRSALVDDALCVGLLRGGVAAARIESLELAGDPDASAWIDAIVDAMQSASHGAPAALAGSWLAGTACAVASSRLPELQFLALACTPSAEVMSRRTPENEDDPQWTSSPTLRLADRLAELSPLEAVTVQARPVFLGQGAVDGVLPAAHLEAWRAALSATGRPADALEVAFADAFFRPVGADGSPADDDDRGLEVLAGAVGAWVSRAVSRGARRGR